MKAIKVDLNHRRECSVCHSFCLNGYCQWDETSSQFVCEDCFAPGEAALESLSLSIPQEEVERVCAEHTLGYILGLRQEVDGRTVLQAQKLLPCVGGFPAGSFFSFQDYVILRHETVSTGLELLGIYRFCALFRPKTNEADRRNIEALNSDCAYVLIAGAQDSRIAAWLGGAEIGTVVG